MKSDKKQAKTTVSRWLKGLTVASALAVATVMLAACGGGGNGSVGGIGVSLVGDSSNDSWVGSWTASQARYLDITPLPGYAPPVPSAYADQTLRQVMRPTLAGKRTRVRFSNLFGTSPLAITASSIAISTGDANIDTGTSAKLQFHGKEAVVIPAGTEIWSDAVDLPVQTSADVAISTYFGVPAPVSTVHSIASRTSYLASGNVTEAASLPSATKVTRYSIVTAIDVSSPKPVRVVAAFGDSITDGFGSKIDSLHNWPSLLARKLQALNSDTRAFSVLNAGISGNRLLNDQVGPSGLSRFQRDVLERSGTTDVIILIGINDIGYQVLSGHPFNLIPESQVVSSDAIIAGMKQLLFAADTKGVNVVLGTILPFKNAGYYNAATEAKRQSVNAWIRSNASTRRVIDFDRVMGSPSDPLALNPAFDSGDHLHPNDAGYMAMADAIDVSTFSN